MINDQDLLVVTNMTIPTPLVLVFVLTRGRGGRFRRVGVSLGFCMIITSLRIITTSTIMIIAATHTIIAILQS